MNRGKSTLQETWQRSFPFSIEQYGYVKGPSKMTEEIPSISRTYHMKLILATRMTHYKWKHLTNLVNHKEGNSCNWKPFGITPKYDSLKINASQHGFDVINNYICKQLYSLVNRMTYIAYIRYARWNTRSNSLDIVHCIYIAPLPSRYTTRVPIHIDTNNKMTQRWKLSRPLLSTEYKILIYHYHWAFYNLPETICRENMNV